MPNAQSIGRPAGILGDGRPVTRKRVAFRDCDPFGILYNTRFLDYVLDVRYEHLIDHHGIDFLKHHYSGGGMFVIVSHQASYFEPVRAHEEVLITTSAIFADVRTMIVEGAITSLDGKRLKFHQWTRLKVLDPKTGEAASITDSEVAEIRRTMTADSIADPNDYQGRLGVVIESMKKEAR